MRINGFNKLITVTTMSQITEKHDAIEIEGFSFERCQADIAAFAEFRRQASIKSLLPELKQQCSVSVIQAGSSVLSQSTKTFSRPTVLSSPSTLHRSFSQSFRPRIATLEKQGFSSIDAKKASVFCALSELDFSISNTSVARTHFQTAFAATNETVLNESLRRGFQELETAHTKVFTAAVAHACAQASVTSGFTEITVKPLPASKGVLVVAKNKRGQALVSEISVNKLQQVNAVTEVIGLHDGTCGALIKQFNNEMKRLGVKFSTDTTRSTRGTVQNVTTQVVKQKDSLERTKKLNQQMRQHN